MQDQSDDRLLTRGEVAERFGISKRFLEISVATGGGPKRVYVGRLVRYRVCDILAWIDENSTGEAS
jgi:predicted DNA-binding transcriptional regulator AlpA